MRKPEDSSELGRLSIIFNDLADDITFGEALEINVLLVLESFEDLSESKWNYVMPMA